MEDVAESYLSMINLFLNRFIEGTTGCPTSLVTTATAVKLKAEGRWPPNQLS